MEGNGREETTLTYLLTGNPQWSEDLPSAGWGEGDDAESPEEEKAGQDPGPPHHIPPCQQGLCDCLPHHLPRLHLLHGHQGDDGAHRDEGRRWRDYLALHACNIQRAFSHEIQLELADPAITAGH